MRRRRGKAPSRSSETRRLVSEWLAANRAHGDARGPDRRATYNRVARAARSLTWRRVG